MAAHRRGHALTIGLHRAVVSPAQVEEVDLVVRPCTRAEPTKHLLEDPGADVLGKISVQEQRHIGQRTGRGGIGQMAQVRGHVARRNVFLDGANARQRQRTPWQEGRIEELKGSGGEPAEERLRELPGEGVGAARGGQQAADVVEVKRQSGVPRRRHGNLVQLPQRLLQAPRQCRHIHRRAEGNDQVHRESLHPLGTALQLVQPRKRRLCGPLFRRPHAARTHRLQKQPPDPVRKLRREDAVPVEESLRLHKYSQDGCLRTLMQGLAKMS
mmetsp:Transcript_47234/g.151602  ORF Transcript_47234/g.151602 Transcript_47234/m.151602 type:complete len:270 (+) Transcript_47234:685-1494(+)